MVQVVQQEPRIHRVIAAGLVPVLDIERGELNVAQPSLRRHLPGQGELDLVGVHAHDRAARRDHLGDGHRDLPAATADVDAAHARGDPRPLKQGAGIGPAVPGQQQEAVVPWLPAPEHISAHRSDHKPGSGTAGMAAWGGCGAGLGADRCIQVPWVGSRSAVSACPTKRPYRAGTGRPGAREL